LSADVIVYIEVKNPEGYKDYVKIAPEAVELYGGKHLVRGDPKETLEGD
jgi:uncharacterized protein (DUF1330 family)